MPQITCKRKGTCTACWGAIRKGTTAWFDEQGLRCATCHAANATGQRTNEFRTRCGSCGELLEPGQGLLTMAEHFDTERGVSLKTWGATCIVPCVSR